MRFVRATKIGTDTLSQLLSRKQCIHSTFPVDPFGFNWVEPGTLCRQTEWQDAHSLVLLSDTPMKRRNQMGSGRATWASTMLGGPSNLLPSSDQEKQRECPLKSPQRHVHHPFPAARHVCLHLLFTQDIPHEFSPFHSQRDARQSYFTTRNERWVAPGVSSVRICSRWIGAVPR